MTQHDQTRVSLTAAMRARDASRPSEEDIARAERELRIVRKNYVPDEPVPAVVTRGTSPVRS